METSPKNAPWTPQRVVHELMAIWFGSVHAVSTTVTFAIHDLCLHPEYVAPLRAECQAQYADFERKGMGLPLLDSFIKESARLTPVESRKFFLFIYLFIYFFSIVANAKEQKAHVVLPSNLSHSKTAPTSMSVTGSAPLFAR